ncbi:MAG: helix-turn-helix domain-containing protein [Helicobacter sp.]|nr:helix-turn-helix domain-containing protein [Helicobacter sp.]
MPYLGYYVVGEVARILGISPRSVHYLIKKGKLVARRTPYQAIIPVSSLYMLLESGYKIKKKSILLSKELSPNERKDLCSPSVAAFIDSLGDELEDAQ